MAKIEPEGRRGKVAAIVVIAMSLFCLLGLIVYTQTVEAIVQVELDIFSGRPNPHWTLNERDSQELLQRLQRLSPTKAGEPSGNLGRLFGWISGRIQGRLIPEVYRCQS